jgi:four helix bundle protein
VVDNERNAALQHRLVRLAGLVCKVAGCLPRGEAGRHIGGQLVRCGTAPAANYAEARSAESRKDFIHKMKVCLKELRETYAWLELARELGAGKAGMVESAISETDELVAIFVTSIATARRSAGSSARKAEVPPTP